MSERPRRRPSIEYVYVLHCLHSETTAWVFWALMKAKASGRVDVYTQGKQRATAETTPESPEASRL